MNECHCGRENSVSGQRPRRTLNSGVSKIQDFKAKEEKLVTYGVN
jgi:hypothetical protein